VRRAVEHQLLPARRRHPLPLPRRRISHQVARSDAGGGILDRAMVGRRRSDAAHTVQRGERG
jgi:hypothetical protein